MTNIKLQLKTTIQFRCDLVQAGDDFYNKEVTILVGCDFENQEVT